MEDRAVSRKARNRQAVGGAGHGREAGEDRLEAGPAREGFGGKAEDETSVFITARTDDGRRVSFRHDEIRDFHDNIRLDYGYAMTIASAQGITVDRAFLLIDDRPSRETVYPAATRHREGIDVYVNRTPIVFDIAEHRTEDEADMPVTDSDVRAYLAERWSRSQPKEAALDYVAEGAWRDAREQAQLAARHQARLGTQPGAQLGRGSIGSEANPPGSASRGDPGKRQGEAAEAANDNAIVRIAREIRHAVNGWRHGAAVDAFAAESIEVMAAWDELRERARAEGEAVALSPAFRQTLDRHRALMKQAASFRARPQAFERLLAERAGIGEAEIGELRNQHARAGKYLRSATARAAHRARQDAKRQDAKRQDAPREEAGIVEALAADAVATEVVSAETVAAGIAAPAAGPAPEESRTVEAGAPGPPRDAPTDWRTLYDELQRDWNGLVARAEEPDLPLPLMHGYDALIGRLRSLAEHSDLSERARSVIDGLLEYHDGETAARETAEGYLAAAERHIEAYRVLERHARQRGVPVARLDAWPQWRETARLLADTGKAVLSNDERYGAYLDAVAAGKPRARLTVDQLRNRLDKNRTVARKPQVQRTRREPTSKQEQGFAHRLDDERKPGNQPRPAVEGERQGIAWILDDPEKLRELRKKAEERDRKLGRHMRKSRGLSM